MEGTKVSSPTPSLISLNNIRGFGKPDSGLFKMSGDLFGWKNRQTGAISQYKGVDVLRAEWIKTTPNVCQLKVYLGPNYNYQIIRFDGFLDKNFNEVYTHFNDVLKKKLIKTKSASRGWHWGEYEIDNKVFRFNIDHKIACEIAGDDVNQIFIPNRTDISIELRSENVNNSADQLTEVRFYMPPQTDNDDVESQLVSIKEQLVDTSRVPETKVESIVNISDVQLLVPRGRFDIDLGKKFIKFHGRSNDYTVHYEGVERMFLVPKPNSPHMNFVIGLKNAVTQGKTRYPFIVMQFESESVLSLAVNLTHSELLSYQLEDNIEGNACDVLTRLLKVFVGKSVVVPGDFKNMNDSCGVTCSFRAASGHLYPLNRSFLFIVKPVIFLRYDDVLSVQFSRVSQTRYFSFTVSVKGGATYEFTSIDRNEYQLLIDFLKSKGLKIRKTEEAPKTDTINGDLPTDSDDENFNVDDEEEEEEEEESDEEYDEDKKKLNSDEEEDEEDDESHTDESDEENENI